MSIYDIHHIYSMLYYALHPWYTTHVKYTCRVMLYRVQASSCKSQSLTPDPPPHHHPGATIITFIGFTFSARKQYLHAAIICWINPNPSYCLSVPLHKPIMHPCLPTGSQAQAILELGMMKGLQFLFPTLHCAHGLSFLTDSTNNSCCSLYLSD